ncbi:carbohydrate kinase family protein [Hyphomonas pacifica]|uniref:Carbohydrate kinase n=1 Tax=Hyphomonas pacifica TaxID=1280941 RepID=A0A062TWV9_9PROT|nr:PfkB family carbohydrate kinase [Hyphomonas pacifica]KCZ49271.1 carbohydrate kinase [Hyphomonas pacifica]RAN31908.1 carbohydrate kinase [Hyphomonas pacifica]
MKLDLLCVGLTTLDVVGRPITEIPPNEEGRLIEQIACAPAGTAGGAACVAARLGVRTGVAGAIGSDLTGKFVRFALEDGGVDTSLLNTLDGYPTSTTILPIDSDGRRPTLHAPGAGSVPPLTDELLQAAALVRCIHYGGIGAPTLDGGPGESLLKAAKAGGAEIICDLIAPRPDAKEELSRLLPYVDWFLPSADEARMLTGEDDLQAAADTFVAMGAKNCVIKDGGRGAVMAAGPLRGRLAAFKIDVVDTTTCGDSFCAGFIAAHLRGMSDADALKFAAATAAMVAQGLATYGKLDSYEQVEAAIQTMPVAEVVE